MTEKNQNKNKKKKPDLNETAFNIARKVTGGSIKSDKDVDKKKPSN